MALLFYAIQSIGYNCCRKFEIFRNFKFCDFVKHGIYIHSLRSYIVSVKDHDYRAWWKNVRGELLILKIGSSKKLLVVMFCDIFVVQDGIIYYLAGVSMSKRVILLIS
jgi:hypothetical protein